MRFTFHYFTPLIIFFLSFNYPFLQSRNTNSNFFPEKKTNLLNTDVRKEDEIIGKWMTLEKNLEVEVYKQGDNFRAKIIWFKVEDKTRPMNTRMDEKNPNPKLRTQKWLGMEVLRNLKYDAQNNKWEHGIIYDAKHGREWDSIAWINDAGLLKVKGYWIFKWISQTLIFEKV